MLRVVARRKGKWRKGSLRSIADILDGAYPGRPEDRVLIRTFSWWDRAVSPRIVAVARPIKLSHGTLIIHTRSASWAQELSFHEEDLLRSVQESVPGVKRLRIKVGPMPRAAQLPDPPKPKVKLLPLAELPGDIARALARVGDDRVRDAVTRAARTSLGTFEEPE